MVFTSAARAIGVRPAVSGTPVDLVTGEYCLEDRSRRGNHAALLVGAAGADSAAHPTPGSFLQEALRLLSDTLRLLKRLALDKTLPRGVRVRLWLLFVYLATPFDLIPDFIPIIGYADDAIIVCAVLRSVVRRAGAEAGRRHWPGSDDGLAALWRAAGLPKD